MNIGHKIILEGCDGTGKSTLANKIRLENPDKDYEIVHCTRHTANNFDYFMELLMSPKNLILDRAFIGQFVYNSRTERQCNGWLSYEDLANIESFINKNHQYIEVIYVTASDKAIYQNCKEDSDDNYYTMDYIKDIKSRYRHYFMNTTLDHVREVFIEIPVADESSSDNLTDEEIDKITANFDYSTLPTIWAVDFDGTLVSGAFPDIEGAYPNDRLFADLIEARKNGIKLILWTNRTGSHLTDACDYCASKGLTFDAVNDNIDELKKALHYDGPRKVYADLYIDDKGRQVFPW